MYLGTELTGVYIFVGALVRGLSSRSKHLDMFLL